MVKVVDAIAKAVAVPVFPISSSLKGEQIIYNIVPLSDDGIKQSNRLELNIIGKTMARAIELDTAIRQALLSIGDLKKNGVLDIEANGGGTLQSEIGVHRLVNYTILQESET
ncbi:Uncharacterised protein [uncultured Clostridium sp.]